MTSTVVAIDEHLVARLHEHRTGHLIPLRRGEEIVGENWINSATLASVVVQRKGGGSRVVPLTAGGAEEEGR